MNVDQSADRVKPWRSSRWSAFTSHLPVRVRFGDGVLAQLPDVLAALGARRPIAFVDAAVAQLPDVAAALGAVATVRTLAAARALHRRRRRRGGRVSPSTTP